MHRTFAVLALVLTSTALAEGPPAKPYVFRSQPRTEEVVGDMFRELDAGLDAVTKKADAAAQAGVKGAMEEGLDRATVVYFEQMAGIVERPVEEVMDVHAEGRARGWWVQPAKRANFARSNPEAQIRKMLQINRDTNAELLAKCRTKAGTSSASADRKSEREKQLERTAAKRKARKGR